MDVLNEISYPTSSREKRKSAYRARHRLHSIARDASSLRQLELSSLSSDLTHSLNWPWLPNKKCGSWYIPTNASTINTEVYFKSTDGHRGTYAFSLKRLNLPLIDVLSRFEGCFLVDSSVRKILPDSFSRTIPIWCCVLNRIVQRFRVELNLDHTPSGIWDTQLHTPASIVDLEEHSEISNLIDSRVELLYKSKAILQPRRLVEMLRKPLRAIWVVNGQLQDDTPANNEFHVCSTSSVLQNNNYFTIVCCNPSTYELNDGNYIHWRSTTNNKCASLRYGYYYTPGAADEEVTWGRKLTPELFWLNKDRFLDVLLTDDDVDLLIDSIVGENQVHQFSNLDDVETSLKKVMEEIGLLNIWIGSWKSGKPPLCWKNFDAVMNVTCNQYPEIIESISEQQEKYGKSCFYLQLPVAEGKRDKDELERWLSVGLCFLIHHLQQKRRVLVHCAQGRDRSVAVVLALVVLHCHLEYPLRFRKEFDTLNLDKLFILTCSANENNITGDGVYLQSGISLHLVSKLLKHDGRDLFLKWVGNHMEAVNKDSLRMALHLVHQYREIAEPTRSTMRKLNRFFMSTSQYMTKTK